MKSLNLTNIIIAVLVLLVVIINLITVINVINHNTSKLTDSNSNTVTSIDPEEFKFFGIPEEIILHGNNTSLSIDRTDENFYKLLRSNEKRGLFIPNLYFATEDLSLLPNYDYTVNTAKHYYIEYIYKDKYNLEFDYTSLDNISSALFYLTGDANGTILLNIDEKQKYTYGLAVNPELNELVVSLLDEFVKWLFSKNWKET